MIGGDGDNELALVQTILFVLLSYLLGSISAGLFLAKRHNVDLRSIGSGNTGATNVGRALGSRAGYAVAFLDAAKGFAPVAFAKHVLKTDPPWIAIIGTATVIGHLWPIWHKFRGGKGVATTLGVFLAIKFWIGALTIAIYFTLRRITRRSSIGSLIAVLAGCILLVTTERYSPISLMGCILTTLVFLRHRDNIRRLSAGTEPP